MVHWFSEDLSSSITEQTFLLSNKDSKALRVGLWFGGEGDHKRTKWNQACAEVAMCQRARESALECVHHGAWEMKKRRVLSEHQKELLHFRSSIKKTHPSHSSRRCCVHTTVLGPGPAQTCPKPFSFSKHQRHWCLVCIMWCWASQNVW